MTTMNIQLPNRSGRIYYFVDREDKYHRRLPITFYYVEKFYTNENGCVDFDKFETIQELVEYMLDHPRMTNYWHTTDELKKLDEIRALIGGHICKLGWLCQNGIIMSIDEHGNMDIKDTVFDIKFDSTMYDIKVRCKGNLDKITEDDHNYTIRDFIRIDHNCTKLNPYLCGIFDGKRLEQKEEWNRRKEMQQEEKTQQKVELELQERMRQKELDRQKEMRQEEKTQRKVELKLQEKMRQEEIDRMRTEMAQLRNEIDRLRGKTPLTIDASIPWYLQTERPISTVFGQCSTQMPSVHTVSTVFEQSTTTSSFM